MLGPLVIIFWVVFIFGSYVGIKYSQSRNKNLFFKEGNYKVFIWSLVALIIAPIILNVLFPNDPIDLSFLKLNSDLTSDIGAYKSEGKFFQYYLIITISVFTDVNLLGLISAGLVFGVWYFYVRSIDFFDQEKIKYTIIIILLGSLFTFLTLPLSDAVHGLLNINYSENTFYNLFVYSFIGIGMIEELVKYIPVLFIVFFTNEVDEPIDLIYYACLSALGFSFIENLIYFRDINGSIIITRALTATVGHMVDSTFVIYGLMLVLFRESKPKAWIIIKYYLIGSFVHALYDYFLFEDLIIFFAVTFIFFIQAWVIIINNALNNSKFFDYSISFQHELVKFKLAEYLVYILIINYFLNGLIVGKFEANVQYVNSISYSSLLIIFYVSSISSFDLVKGHWRPVKFQFSIPSDEALPGMRGVSTFRKFFTANTITPLNHVGKNIKLHAPGYNYDLLELFTIGEGKIIDRVTLSFNRNKGTIEDNTWFVVQLKNPLDVNINYDSELILIKIKDTFASFLHDEHIKCWLKLIPNGMDPRKENDGSAFRSYGYIMINGEDYEYDLE